MARISSIEVSFRRSRQPAQYESEEMKVGVVLSFSTEEENPGLDEAIEDLADTCQAHVLARLGLKAAPVKAREVVVQGEPAAVKAEPAKKADAKPAAAKKADAKPAENTAPKSAPVAENKPAANGASALSDGDMTLAVTQHMKKCMDAGFPTAGQEILKVIKEFVSVAPFSPAKVPSEKRAEFMTRLQSVGPQAVSA